MLVNEEQASNQAESPILHPSSRALFRFWEQMRAENPAPRRDELDLSRIRQLVPHLLIANLEEKSGTFRYRLAGTGICEIFRREVTGFNILTGWDTFETNVAQRFLRAVVKDKQPGLIRFRLHTDLGQTIGAELIGLPMLALDGETIHILGGMFPFRDVWSLGYAKITGVELTGARSIWTEHLPGDALLSQTAQTPFRGFQVITGGRS